MKIVLSVLEMTNENSCFQIKIVKTHINAYMYFKDYEVTFSYISDIQKDENSESFKIYK